jgi:UPF0755 protein
MIRRLLLGLAVLAVVAMVVATAVLAGSLWRQLDNPAVEFEVTAGSTAQQVLAVLSDHGLLPSRLAGRLYLKLASDGRSFHYGHYRIPAASRPVDVMERILAGRVETITVTVVEGLMVEEAADLLTASGLGTIEQWRRLISTGDWIHDLAPEASSLEGFLYPDTYRFAIGLDAKAAARHMVDRFREVWQLATTGVEDPWGSTYEVVTMASLVEAETSVSEERSRIAGVFLNRLRRGMPLQCDPTVVYGLRMRGEWQGRLLRRHWLLDDLYNTYRYPGLPPGPINSPGRAALAAALNPEEHSLLYFVARPGGGHTFSRTLSEHNRAVAQLRSSRR